MAIHIGLITVIVFLAMAIGSSADAIQHPGFFPNATKVYMPRGSANLLKPYLPRPQDAKSPYGVLIETPDYVHFVAVEPSLGSPPQKVTTSPGQLRDGVKYIRHKLAYDCYPPEWLGLGSAEPVAVLLFEAKSDAPEGVSRIFTQASGPKGPIGEIRETSLLVLPTLKNVRPKEARIAPCLCECTNLNQDVAAAYAKNLWESGSTWTVGSVQNGVVPLLWPKGYRVWLLKPGDPFGAVGAATEYLGKHPDLMAVALNGKPLAGRFCPTWLLSPAGKAMRQLMEGEFVALLNKDGYTAVCWDIEQAVIRLFPGEDAPRGFCLCPRCIDAFRQRNKIGASETIDLKAITGLRRNAWVAFRCQQNAELVRHVSEAVKTCDRPVEFALYSGSQSQETREQYGVDWHLLAPHSDLAIVGYDCSREVLADTRTALGKVPLMGGRLYGFVPARVLTSMQVY